MFHEEQAPAPEPAPEEPPRKRKKKPYGLTAEAASIRKRGIQVTRTLDQSLQAFLAATNGEDQVEVLPVAGPAALEALGKRFGVKSKVAKKFLLTMVSPPDRVQAEIAYNRTRHALLSMRPTIAAMLLEKAARGKNVPYDREILLQLAKSGGLLIDQAPMDNQEREAADQRAMELSEMSVDALKDRVLDKLRLQNGESE